ncbi:MAG: GreA/GreB family elongation factor [Burkholderiales bacterium]
MEMLAKDRTLTELDCARLTILLRRAARDRSAAPLPVLPTGKLRDFVAVVSPRHVPHDVVTMYSQVVVRHVGTDWRETLTLCYPPDANPAAGFVSILSPAGWSLLGLAVGAVARWSDPSDPAGEHNEVEVEEILFQPESSGDYSM